MKTLIFLFTIILSPCMLFSYSYDLKIAEEILSIPKHWFILLFLAVLISIIYGAIKFYTYKLNKQALHLRKELKQEHHKLSELQAVLSAFFSHASTGLIITNEDGEVIHSNETAGKLLRLHTNLDGKNFKELDVYKQYTEITNAFYKSIIYPIRKTEVTIVEKDKTRERNLYFQFFNLNTVRRNMILIIISDITAFTKSKFLDIKMNAYNQLFATLSHYLNNSMTIMGLAVQKYQMADVKDCNELGQFVDFTTQKISFILKTIEDKIQNREIENHDDMDSKDLLIDIESSLKEFEEKTRSKFELLRQHFDNN